MSVKSPILFLMALNKREEDVSSEVDDGIFRLTYDLSDMYCYDYILGYCIHIHKTGGPYDNTPQQSQTWKFKNRLAYTDAKLQFYSFI